MAVGKSHVTSRHLLQIPDTAYDATIPALRSLFNAIDGLPCDCKLYPAFYSGTASVLPGCVECCEVREVCLLANPDISQRLRVSKYGIEVIANSVMVFSTRGVIKPYL